MTLWTGWERRESHANSALPLSLPKLDVSYRKAQANKLDLSTVVQIQVSSAWFCSCLYGNDLASVRAFCNIAKSVEVVGSQFGQTWSRASQSYNVTLETQSWTCNLVPSCWFQDIGLKVFQLSSCLWRISHKTEPAKSALDTPCVMGLFSSSSWNSQDRMEQENRNVQETSWRPLSQAEKQGFGGQIRPFYKIQGELRTWALNQDVSLGSDLLIPVLSLLGMR